MHTLWLTAELMHLKFELSEIFEITNSFFIPTAAYHASALHGKLDFFCVYKCNTVSCSFIFLFLRK